MSVEIQNQLDIPEAWGVYEKERNFEIITNNVSQAKSCYIFFSSNGIYFPNTSEEFITKIVRGNRFEWKRNLPNEFAKVIFVRDVFKQWYLEGINSQINSIESLVEFLKKETQGLEITCVGSSAGGYAATLFGTLLQAERVFNFSGQFSLWHSLKEEDKRQRNPILVKHESNSEVNQYFDIIDLLKTRNLPIFYFYPGKCAEDIQQSQLVKNITNIYDFKFDDATHGCTVLAVSLRDLFSLSSKELIKLHQKNRNKMIKPLSFSMQVSGLRKTGGYLIGKTCKTLRKKRKRTA